MLGYTTPQAWVWTPHPVGVGLETPPARSPPSPLGVGLETPSPSQTSHIPPGCGPKDPPGQTPQHPPWVWSWRPPWPDPPNLPSGVGLETPPPVDRILDTCFLKCYLAQTSMQAVKSKIKQHQCRIHDFLGVSTLNLCGN